MRLSPAIQEALLALLLYDDSSAPIVATLVEPSLFDPYFKELAELGVNYLRDYREPAGEHTLDLINHLCERAPKSEATFRRIFKSIQETREGINAPYVLKQAGAFVRHQRIRRGLTQAVNALQSKSEDAINDAETAMRAALTDADATFDHGLFMEETERVLAFLDRGALDGFPTGIKFLDERGLGPARGRLHVFAGRLGTGKSWWLINLAKHALIYGLRVAYISLELSQQEVAQRLVQSFFAASKRSEPIKLRRFKRTDDRFELDVEESNDLLAFDQDGVREVLSRKLGVFKRRQPIAVRQFPSGALTQAQLLHYLDALEATHKFIPDLVIVDHASLMRTDARNYRVSVGQVYTDLRGLAVERNVAVATASQLNRESARVLWADATHLSEADLIGQVADYVVTYNQTPAERELELARLYVAKGRTDRDRFGFVVSQAYGIGQFCLDAMGVVPSYWDAVQPQVPKDSDASDDSD